MYNAWLMEAGAFELMQSRGMAGAASAPAIMAAISSRSGDASNVMEMAGDVARINVTGVLTAAPDWMAMFFGGGNTTYGDISAAIIAAETDPNVKKVEFYFDSPGGEAQPVSALADQIYAMKKPTTALVSTAASAAYWLASQAKKVVAIGDASMVGSVGAMVSIAKPSEMFSVDITSRDAPNKRPDPETEEGKGVIQDFLDQMSSLFVMGVAVGRDTTEDNVHNNFGKGGMLLARQALEAGMIDEIAQQTPQKKSKSNTTGVKTMDLATLKAEHPGLYAAASAEGHQAGVDAERDRIKYHLTLGQKMGAESIAITACLEGKGKDDGELTAQYLSAGVNKRALDDRSNDEKSLEGNQSQTEDENAKATRAASAIFAQFGEIK